MEEVKSELLEGPLERWQQEKDMRRRVKYFCLGVNQFMGIMHGLLRVDMSVIPEDAEYVRCEYSFLHDGFLIIVRHPTFDKVPEGLVPPHIWLEYECVKKQPKEDEEETIG